MSPCPSRKSIGPHRQMNLLLSRLDEQQRRWYAAVESAKLGHGGDRPRLPHHRPARRYHPPGPGGTGGLARGPPRRPGPAPRRRAARPRKKVPEIIPALLSIVGPQTGGDPMGQTKFVRRSLRGPQHGPEPTGLLGLPHDRGPAPPGPGLLAPDQRQAVHRAGPPRPGPAVRQHPRSGSTSSRSWASRSSASTPRRRN